ncbi:MAG: hypothetical protein VKL60_15030 [Sphaerospermopsis sp.]|nr:hypothetical protein [Sphaerospermopsis sp.]
MPIIEITNPESQAKGRLAAWFNTQKQRHGSKKNRDLALRRMNEDRRQAGKPLLRRKDIHSFHHLNKDRSAGKPENLFGCVTEDQHKNIELQGIELFTTLFDLGKIGFDYVTKKYFIACDWLEQEIREWINRGQPKQWVILGHGETSKTN